MLKRKQRERKARRDVPEVHDTTVTSSWGRGKLGLLVIQLNPVNVDNGHNDGPVGLSEVRVDPLGPRVLVSCTGIVMEAQRLNNLPDASQLRGKTRTQPRMPDGQA